MDTIQRGFLDNLKSLFGFIECIKVYEFYFYKEVHTMALTSEKLQQILSGLTDTEQQQLLTKLKEHFGYKTNTQ